MATLVLMGEEEAAKYKNLCNLRFTVLTDMLSGEAGDTPLNIVFNRYRQFKGNFFNTSTYDFPSDYMVGQDLLLNELPFYFGDCWLTEEELLTKDFDYIEEFAKLYLGFHSIDNSYSRPIRLLDFINEEIWPELSPYKKWLNGNINIHLKSFVNKANVLLTTRDYFYEICRYINDNKFSFSSDTRDINLPYTDNPQISYRATISFYSCSTIGDSYKKLQPFRGCTPLSIKCFYQNYKDAVVPFEDYISDIWYNKEIIFWNRKTWLYSLFLITKGGYYIPLKDIIDGCDLCIDDDDISSPSYGMFLSGAIRMVYSYAYTEKLTDSLPYLLNLLKNSKISIFKDKNSKYSFLYSLPYYSWIK